MDLDKLIFKRDQLRLVLANVTECFNDAYRYNYGCEGGCAGSCEGCCADCCVPCLPARDKYRHPSRPKPGNTPGPTGKTVSVLPDPPSDAGHGSAS